MLKLLLIRLYHFIGAGGGAGGGITILWGNVQRWREAFAGQNATHSKGKPIMC